VQEGLAAACGLALLTVEGRQPPELAVSNNNSICQAFQSSSAHAHLCLPDCGEAYFRATESDGAVHYRCHAGLQCFAAPVQIGGKKTRAVIGGRCFLRVADYRALAERIRAGDLTDLLSADLFANVIFASRQDLDDLAARVEESARAFAAPRAKGKESEPEAHAPKAQAASASNGSHKVETQEAADAKEETSDEAPQATPKVSARGKSSKAEPTREGPTKEETAEVADEVEEPTEAEAPRHAYAQTRAGAAHAGSLDETCRRAVLALTQDYRIDSLALLLRADDSFYATCVTGLFERRAPRVTLKPKEIKLLLAATGGDSIAVPAGGRTSSKHEDAVELFPLLVGEEIKGALLVGDADLEDEQRRAVAAFCRDISMPLELLRLREELERKARAASQLRAFTEVVNSAQPDDAYTTILRHSAELLRSERGSLLLFDERAGELSVKAAVGPRADVAREARVRIGEGVSGTVMREGRPAVVRDVSKGAGRRPATFDTSRTTAGLPSRMTVPATPSPMRTRASRATSARGPTAAFTESSPARSSKRSSEPRSERRSSAECRSIVVYASSGCAELTTSVKARS